MTTAPPPPQVPLPMQPNTAINAALLSGLVDQDQVQQTLSFLLYSSIFGQIHGQQCQLLQPPHLRQQQQQQVIFKKKNILRVNFLRPFK